MIKRLCFAFMALMIEAVYANNIKTRIWDFVYAARDGDLATAKWLVDRGVLNFTRQERDGYIFFVGEALGEATTNGHLAMVRYLVNNVGINVNSKFGTNPKNPVLLEAADKGHLAIVQFLVSKGANVNLIGNCGESPLYVSANDAIWDYLQPKTKGLNTTLALFNASRRGNLEQVKSFFEQLKKEGKDINDIKVNATNYNCETSALVEASYYGHLEVVKFLVENGANVNNIVKGYLGMNRDTALVSASANGHLEVVKYLVENGANINNGRNALEVAAEEGHLAVVQYLVSQGANAKINLYDATKNGHFEVAKYLISQGADIRRALHGAIARGDLGFVKYALSQGIDLTDTYYPNSGYINTNRLKYLPPKTQAEESKYLANTVEITRLLIANGAKIYENDLIYAVEPTQYASQSRGTYPHYFEIVKMLVNNGANVNYQNKSGETALMYAVRNSAYIDITQYLLQHGASASINVVDERGETALDKALGEKQIALLKRYGAKYNKRRKSSDSPRNAPKAPPNVHIQNHKSDSPRNAPRFPPNVHIRIID